MASARTSNLGQEPPGRGRHDVLEFPLLLTATQVDALERASRRRGLTPGQLARRAIGDFLRGSCEPPDESRASAGGRHP